jgi:hypothetical protein
MKRPHALAVTCASVALLLVRPAAADETAGEEGEEAEEAGQGASKPAQSTVAVATLGGAALIVDGAHADGSGATAPAWTLEFAMKPQSFPLLFGVGFGSGYFDVERPNGDPYTTVVFRRFEVLTRYQPYWGIVRPYAQASLGVGWMSYAKSAVVLGSDEERHASMSAIASLGLGIDWRLFWLSPEPNVRQSVVLSTGVKRLFATSGLHPATQGDETLGMWMPFVAVGVSFEPPARRTRPPPVAEPEPVTIEVKGVKETEPGPHYR